MPILTSLVMISLTESSSSTYVIVYFSGDFIDEVERSVRGAVCSCVFSCSPIYTSRFDGSAVFTLSYLTADSSCVEYFYSSICCILACGFSHCELNLSVSVLILSETLTLLTV